MKDVRVEELSTGPLFSVREALIERVREAQIFWTEAFRDVHSRTLFTTSPKHNISNQDCTFTLKLDDKQLQDQLHRVEKECGIERKILFEALWAIVVQSHTTSEEAVFGAANQACSLLGELRSTDIYPLRITTSPDTKFVDLVSAIEDFHRRCFRHGYFGLAEISHLLPEALQSAVYYSLTPLGKLDDLPPVPLVLVISSTSTLQLSLHARSTVEPREAEILLSHFVVALQSALSKPYLPHATISSINLASLEEQFTTVRANRSNNPEHASTIVHLFEETARKHPTRIAIENERHDKLSYDELNIMSNRLSRRLPIDKGDIVPVCMDRSTDLIVTLLAILKAGSAYTVLDPDGPSERNAQIVAASDAKVVIANDKYAELFANAIEVDILLTACRQSQSMHDGYNRQVTISADDKSYIIYTSGSTGKPKGVVLTHRAATNGMHYHNLNGRNRWLLFYNPTFSAAQRTMLSTLVHGGTLIVAQKSAIQSNLAGLIQSMRVQSLGITPSALSTIRPSDVPTLEQVTLVGALVTEWADHVDLRNTYGLSEVTQLNFGTRLTSKSNPRVVGRPSDTTSVYVLVPGTTELAPTGVAGELGLAGPQLGLGYLADPERTDKVFIDNPFGRGKLYRTGDLARMRHDGSIEILGRIDFQAKIAGQKVEPAEIDAALIKHEDIRSSITVAADVAQRRALVTGVVVQAADWTSTLQSIRRHAELLLPGYMIPSYWLRLEEVPKNINGKADLLRFRNMVEGMTVEELLEQSLATTGGSTAVQDPMEQSIASIWAKVLNLDPSLIKREHSFVALGGSSVQAIRALQELRKAGLQTTLNDILSEMSIAQASSTYTKLVGNEEQDLLPFELIKSEDLKQSLSVDPNVIDAYPATALQQELLSSLGTEHDHYIYRRIWDASGLDLEKLKRSFETAFEQSDILKTSFIVNGRDIFQVVRSDAKLPWTETDLDLETFIAQDESIPMSMEGPLFRITLISRQLLVVSMHHSFFDFWSYRFLYEDVARIYQGLDVPPRAPFKRYISHISGSDERASRRFWKKQLTGAEQTMLNHHPSTQTSKLSRKVALGKIHDQGKTLGLTTGAILYTAWAILLYKHTGHADVTFMTSLSGRDAPVSNIDRIDGPTLSMAPLRTTIDPEQKAADMAKSIGAAVRQVAEHSHYGLRNALSAAGLQQGLFDTFLNILISPQQDPSVEAVFKRYGPEWSWDNAFTTMEVEETPEQLVFRLSGRMDGRLLSYVLDSYILIIEEIVADPHQKLSGMDVIAPAEREYLQNTLSNRKTLKTPAPELLHARFEAHATKTPDAVAIDWNGADQVTYSELDDRANQLAHHLIEQGCRVGDRIPLLLEKSIDTIVAILGVMKAGAAYVPLNPENPVERNLFIMNDVEAKTLIMHSVHADFCSHHDLPTIMIDQLDLRASHTSGPVVSTTPGDLAYIIYTSGSSGTPKGVKVPHRSAAAAVTSMEVAEGRGAGAWRTLQFANYVFDASVQDIFNTLSTCGTLCMAPQDEMLSNLAGKIQSMRVKQAIITPTVAKLLKPSEVPTMTTLIVGGEPLTSDVVSVWGPDHQILNVYGPTETSMVVTTKDVQQGDLISNIGAPFPTVMAFIVDPDGLSLIPYGAVGELCIAGPQVTDGYVNRPDLTSAAFVDGEELGVDKLYRTGDLARWLPNGEISCLGRKDGQVKIHGHRIELGEIEVALLKTGLVEESAVVVSTVNGKPTLVAFCVFDTAESSAIRDAEEHAEDIKLLREGLTHSGLTPYMIPGVVLPVGSLPKLPSRKVDRKTLKKQVEQLDAAFMRQYSLCKGPSHAHEAPETENEVVLEKAWSAVLNIPLSDIGRKADFRALGGDSIAAISLSSHVSREKFTLSVNNILKHSRLDEMAAKMQAKSANGSSQAKPAFVVPTEAWAAAEAAGLNWESDVEYVYPCPPGQAEFASQGSRDEQMWVLMTVRRMPAGTDLDKWISATTELIRIEDILRTSWLCLASGDWVGVVLRSNKPRLEVIDCASESASTEIIEKFWAEKFVFGEPWIKFALLKYPDGSFDTVVKLNHAVYDGTLLRIFDDHFGAILAGQPIPPHGQFKDFAFHIYNSDKAQTLDFWKQTMADRRSAYLSEAISPKITAAKRSLIDTQLDDLVSSTGVSQSSIFQAAYQLWLSRASGDSDVNFDYLLSGRNIDLPDPLTINGTLANFLPVRHKIDQDSCTLQDFLQATQDGFWAMSENGNVGLHDIYAAAGLDRQAFGNRTLFLFQPFEPAGAPDEMRWLILAKSRVRMYQPYALVVEVAKAPEGRHKLAVMYDETVFDVERVESIVVEIKRLVENFAKPGMEGALLKEF
ncbi:Nonribosomal peptide synthetase 3 [Cercospora beticola]|uniref:Nonribosomal peptide synthetase 3 n=1 Tax=Cercospora beticola TaxID=122368 RepID=A0A2G5H9Q3_CERBT|nr:Nonribosomal peptide synthetase 3 [Cercospora beticola]PIA89264.1 Nonribosomal peptide synthetase 3 [Cercospora beticola]WPB03834.1 hypothetical protein RHO25_008478 [Cercospora beticola]